MTSGLWDPTVSEHAEKKFPDRRWPLVSWKRQVRRPRKDLTPAPSLGSSVAESDKKGWACQKGTTQMDPAFGLGLIRHK